MTLHPRHVGQKMVGLSGGSSVRRPGSEDPHRRSRNCGSFSLFIFIQEFIDNVSDGEEAKPNDDDNKALSDLLGDDTQTESTNLLAGLDTQVDNQIDRLSLQKDT
jgi:hypothetical protein